MGDGYYLVPINYQTDDALAVLGDRYEALRLSDDDQTGYALKVQFTDDKNWFVIDQEIIGKQ